MDTHKSDFDKVVHKAISDESFREKLKTDPHGALKDAGVEPTEEKGSPFAAPFSHGGAVFLTAHMAPDLRASCRSELAGEMPDPTRGAVDQHLAP